MAKKKKSAEGNATTGVSFEEALEKLEQIVSELEDGRIGLDESLARYEQGIKYLTQCHQLLQKAERKIALLSGVDEQGNPLTELLDDEEMSLEQKADTRSRRRSRPANPDNNVSDEPSGGSDTSDVDEYRGLF